MGKNITDEYIGKYLSIARRAHASLLDKKLKPYDICHGQILLLVTIFKNEGINQYELCNIYNLDKAGVNRSIKHLKKTGYITMEPDHNDRRKKKIYLTTKAKKFKPKLTKILKTVENQVRKNLEQKEIKNFLQVMKKITDNLGVNLDS
ncbi:MAG: MarR family winged helix-turn-helix transcriptional regulator [Bacillota bacterium]